MTESRNMAVSHRMGCMQRTTLPTLPTLPTHTHPASRFRFHASLLLQAVPCSPPKARARPTATSIRPERSLQSLQSLQSLHQTTNPGSVSAAAPQPEFRHPLPQKANPRNGQRRAVRKSGAAACPPASHHNKTGQTRPGQDQATKRKGEETKQSRVNYLT